MRTALLMLVALTLYIAAAAAMDWRCNCSGYQRTAATIVTTLLAVIGGRVQARTER